MLISKLQFPTMSSPRRLVTVAAAATLILQVTGGASPAEAAESSPLLAIYVTPANPTTYAGLADTTLTATDYDAVSTSWSWRTTPVDCILGDKTTRTISLQCPSSTTGTLGIIVTAGSDDGQTTTAYGAAYVGGVYPTTKSLAVSPTTVDPGESVTATARTTYGAKDAVYRGTTGLQASTDGITWTTVVDPADSGPTGERTMTVTASATLEYRAVVNSGGELVYGDPVAVTVRSATKTTLTTSGTYPAHLAATVTASAGKAVAAAPVALQVKWSGSTTWSTVTTLTTGSTGKATYTYRPTRAGTFRYVYAGGAATLASSSSAKLIKVPTKLSISAKKGVIKGKLTTAAGAALKSATVVLQYRSGNTWKTLRTVKTTSSGTVSVKVKPKKSTHYRLRYAGSATDVSVTSAQTIVKP
jgi:hypothetical protein